MGKNTGKRVRVHYVGTLDDGTEFDSSLRRNQPLEFVCMSGQMIPGFDEAVDNMDVGQTVKVHIPAAQAYGERDENAVQKVPADKIPNADKLPIGEMVQMRDDRGNVRPVRVVSIEDGVVTFDLNHALAGCDLNFEIALLSADDGMIA